MQYTIIIVFFKNKVVSLHELEELKTMLEKEIQNKKK